VGDADAVVANVEVDAVQADGMHAQQRLTRLRHGLGKVAQLQAFTTAGFEDGSLHGGVGQLQAGESVCRIKCTGVRNRENTEPIALSEGGAC
jgi:hypothetical protein